MFHISMLLKITHSAEKLAFRLANKIPCDLDAGALNISTKESSGVLQRLFIAAFISSR
jgi:hypothetical protein